MCKKVYIAAAVKALDALDNDSEMMHSVADDILRDFVPAEVREAYERVIDRAEFWATA